MVDLYSSKGNMIDLYSCILGIITRAKTLDEALRTPLQHCDFLCYTNPGKDEWSDLRYLHMSGLKGVLSEFVHSHESACATQSVAEYTHFYSEFGTKACLANVLEIQDHRGVCLDLTRAVDTKMGTDPWRGNLLGLHPKLISDVTIFGAVDSADADESCMYLWDQNDKTCFIRPLNEIQPVLNEHSNEGSNKEK